MEKSEPTFVPEWLQSSGSVTSAVSTNHHQIASSSLLSDDLANETVSSAGGLPAILNENHPTRPDTEAPRSHQSQRLR